MLGIRKARARGELEELVTLEEALKALYDEYREAKKCGVVRESAYLDDDTETEMGDLDRYAEPGVIDNEGVTHAEETPSEDDALMPLGRVPS